MAWTRYGAVPVSARFRNWSVRPGKWIVSVVGNSYRTDTLAAGSYSLCNFPGAQKEAYAACSDGESWYAMTASTLFKSTDGLVGNAWEVRGTPPATPATQLEIIDGVMAVLVGNKLYLSTDLGLTWGASKTLLANARMAWEGTTWVAYDSGETGLSYIRVSLNSGATWANSTPPVFASSAAVVNGVVYTGSRTTGKFYSSEAGAAYVEQPALVTGDKSVVVGHAGRLWVCSLNAGQYYAQTVGYSATPLVPASFTTLSTVTFLSGEMQEFRVSDKVEAWGSGETFTEELPYYWPAVVVETLTDAAVAEDTIEVEPVVEMTDTVADEAVAADALEGEGAMAVEDAAAAEDSVSGMSDAPIVTDEAAAADASTSEVVAVLTDSAAAGDSTASGGVTDTVEDTAVTDDAASGVAVSTDTIGDDVRAADAVEQPESEDTVVDQAAASDAATSSVTIDGTVSDAAVSADSVSGAALAAPGEASSEAAATDATTVQVSGTDVILDAAVATDAVFYKDNARIAWVLNTESGAASWYGNFRFHAIAQVGGRTFAVGDAGLTLLEGTTDDGDTIDATVTWGFTEFGGYDDSGRPKPSENLKRPASYYFGYTSDGTLDVGVQTHGENNGPYTYTMPVRDASAPRAGRVSVGKGMRGRYWRVSVSNEAGADFAVDSVSADIMQTNRKI